MKAEGKVSGTEARRVESGTAARGGKGGKRVAKLARRSAGRKSPPARARRAITKAAYVREQPLTIPAREVVEHAAELGLMMTPDYVHKVRSTAKARNPELVSGMSSRQDARKEAPSRSSGEAGFRRLVLELGLARSRALLADVERRLGALISS